MLPFDILVRNPRVLLKGQEYLLGDLGFGDTVQCNEAQIKKALKVLLCKEPRMLMAYYYELLLLLHSSACST